MPGTLCSILSVIILYFCDISYKKNIAAFFFVILLLLSIFCVKNFLEQVNEKDPGFIVIDEFLGVLLGLIIFFTEKNLKNYFIFLVLFRIFDIFKPWPVNLLDKLSQNGTFLRQACFIIADDLVAGVMASVVLCVINSI